MTADTATAEVEPRIASGTRALTGPPVITSGAEAIRTSRQFAASSHDPVAWQYHHVGNCLLNHGQI